MSLPPDVIIFRTAVVERQCARKMSATCPETMVKVNRKTYGIAEYRPF